MMDLKTLRRLAFAGFIAVVIVNIITGIITAVMAAVGGYEALSIVSIVFLSIRILVSPALVAALIMNVVLLKSKSDVEDKEKLFVQISLIAIIVNAFLKIVSGIGGRAAFPGGPLLNVYQVARILNGVASFFTGVAFLVSVIFFILAWFLYGKKREETQL